MAAGSNQITASTATTRLVNVQTVRLDQTIDQRLTAEVTYVPDAEILKYNARYIRVMEEPCDPDVKPSLEQLSALAHILGTSKAPYADFSVFGPHGVRFQK